MRRLPLLFSVAIATALLPAGPAAAHTPPAIYLSYEVEEDLTLTVTVNSEIFRDWTGIDPEAFEPDDPAVMEVSEKFVAGSGRVQVDRIDVRGVVTSVDRQEFLDHELPWLFVKVVVTYGLKERPREVALAWTRFDNSLAWYIGFIEAEITTGNTGNYLEFTREEPEYVWHAPKIEEARVRAPALPRPPEPLTLPPGLLGVLLALLLSLPVLHFARASRGVCWGLVALAASLSVAFAWTARVEVRPPWLPGFERPSVEQADALFRSLQANIYRAFDYDSEEEIYDTLAQSVTGDLLDRIYTDVYTDLVMEDQGGAVATVQAVRVIDAEVLFPEDRAAPHFDVRCRWRVLGKVGHWGHTHQRLNEYRALYTLTQLDQEWRIAGVEVLDQKRIEDLGEEGWVDDRKPK